jgi:3-methyladenine DNA glycosylase AlkD
MESEAEVLGQLKSLSRPEYLKGMSRFGINIEKAFGVPVPELRSLARKIGKNHGLAQKLWSSGYHEARILATMIDDPVQIIDEQMEDWVTDFDSWDLCDQCCGNLFDKTKNAYEKAIVWSEREEEFTRRAGYGLMAYLAVHEEANDNAKFLEFLSIIERDSIDERNFVKKAANWALRQIGKRNQELHKAAIETAKSVQKKNSRAAKWIASDALRELTSVKVKEKLLVEFEERKSRKNWYGATKGVGPFTKEDELDSHD